MRHGSTVLSAGTESLRSPRSGIGIESADGPVFLEDGFASDDVRHSPDMESTALTRQTVIRRNRWLNMKAELERVGSLGARAFQEASEIIPGVVKDDNIVTNAPAKYPHVPVQFFEFSDEEEQAEEQKDEPHIVKAEVIDSRLSEVEIHSNHGSDGNVDNVESIDFFNQLIQDIVEERRVEDAHTGRSAHRRLGRPLPKKSKSPPRQDLAMHDGAELMKPPPQYARGANGATKRVSQMRSDGKQPEATRANRDTPAAIANESHVERDRSASRSKEEPLPPNRKSLNDSTRQTLTAPVHHDGKGGWIQNDNITDLNAAVEIDDAEEAQERAKHEGLKEKRRIEKERLKMELQKQKLRLQEQLAAASTVEIENRLDGGTSIGTLTKREDKARLIEQREILKKELREVPLYQVQDEAQERCHVVRLARKKAGTSAKHIDEDIDREYVGEMLSLERRGYEDTCERQEFLTNREFDDSDPQQDSIGRDEHENENLNNTSNSSLLSRSSGRVSLVATAPIVASLRISGQRRSRSEELPAKSTGYRMMQSRHQRVGRPNRSQSPPNSVKPKQSRTKQEIHDHTSPNSLKMQQLKKHIKENAPVRSARRGLHADCERLAKLFQRENTCETFRDAAVSAIHNSEQVLDKMLQRAAKPEAREVTREVETREGNLDDLAKLFQQEDVSESYRIDAIKAIGNSEYALDEMLRLAALPENRERKQPPVWSHLVSVQEGVDNLANLFHQEDISETCRIDAIKAIGNSEYALDEMLRLAALSENQERNQPPVWSHLVSEQEGVDNLANLFQQEDTSEAYRIDALVAFGNSEHVLDEMLRLATVPENQVRNAPPVWSHVLTMQEGLNHLSKLFQQEDLSEAYRLRAVKAIGHSEHILDQMLQPAASPTNQERNQPSVWSHLVSVQEGVNNLANLFQQEDTSEAYRIDALVAFGNSEHVLDEMLRLATVPENQVRNAPPVWSHVLTMQEGLNNLSKLFQQEDLSEAYRLRAVKALGHSEHILDQMIQPAASPTNQERTLQSHVTSMRNPDTIDEFQRTNNAEKESNTKHTNRSDVVKDDFDDVWEATVLSRITVAKQEAKAEVEKQMSKTLAELNALKASALANVQHNVDNSDPSTVPNHSAEVSRTPDTRLLESLQKFETEIVSVVQMATSADERASTAEKMLNQVKNAYQDANRRAMANKLRSEVGSKSVVLSESGKIDEALALVLGAIASAGEAAKAEVNAYFRKAMQGLQDAEKAAISTVQSSAPANASHLAQQYANAMSATDVDKYLNRLDCKIVHAHRRAHSAEIKTKAAEKKAREADAKRRQAEAREKANAALKEHDFQTRLYMMKKPKGQPSLDASISHALGKIEKAKTSVDEIVQRVLDKLETVESAAAASLKRDPQ